MTTIQDFAARGLTEGMYLGMNIGGTEYPANFTIFEVKKDSRKDELYAELRGSKYRSGNSEEFLWMNIQPTEKGPAISLNDIANISLKQWQSFWDTTPEAGRPKGKDGTTRIRQTALASGEKRLKYIAVITDICKANRNIPVFTQYLCDLLVAPAPAPAPAPVPAPPATPAPPPSATEIRKEAIDRIISGLVLYRSTL